MGLKGGGKFEGHGFDVEVVGRKGKRMKGVCVIDEGDRWPKF
jgi:hypothetical protein